MRKRVGDRPGAHTRSSYVLFDEPTTSLDPVSARTRRYVLIRELSDKLGVTSIVVSHDLPSIFTIADRIVMLYRGKVLLLRQRATTSGQSDERHRPAVHQRSRHRSDGV